MNKLIIIENEKRDFESIKSKFSDWTIFPEEHNIIEYDNNDSILLTVKKAIDEEQVSAIVIDISLINSEDKTGIEIIKQIRNQDNIRYKIIPIFCYSRHGDDREIRKEAFTAGATNIFRKSIIDSQDEEGIDFLKKSLLALAFIYSNALGRALDLEEVNSSLHDIIQHLGLINKKINSQLEVNKLNLLMSMNISSSDDMTEMTVDKKNKEILINLVGSEEKLMDLMRKKCRKEDKEKREQLMDDIADIISDLPVLFAPQFAALFRCLKILLKSM